LIGQNMSGENFRSFSFVGIERIVYHHIYIFVYYYHHRNHHHDLMILCRVFTITYLNQITFRRFIIIIVIIIISISFMQGIYTYIIETNCVPREHSVAAILLLLFTVLISTVPVLNLLYFYNSTFRSMCAVPNMAGFCSSLTSCFPGMLLTYFLNDFEIVPFAPIFTGYHLCFLHSTCAVFLL